ncbi:MULTISPECIES: pyocin knob domain-containing protein [unclassified Leclercia]|uniref:pyocin knob domain-containing protein n=1 Tax=unclassified Leclercia TaxID=2627398 RepID=UPI0025C223B0|nr:MULTISPECIES: pyocin knob domain-containing protein [unclassified Leclercia]
MATIDDNLAKTVTEAFRQAQIDISNQDKLLVGPGDVTLTRADGTTFTGPSWPKMAGITSSAMQWRGGIPASTNLNTMGPNSTYVGAWGQSSVSATAADLANGYPAAERGVLEIFAGGRSNGTQRYTTDAGRLFIRWLTGSWNGSGPWSDWSEVGGLSSNTVLPAAVGLSDAAYFSQNQTYVLSGSRTDLPAGINGNAVIMSIRRQGGTIAGLNQLLFTTIGTYERHGAPNAATGWTSVSWYAGGDANGWRLMGADAMAAIGIGLVAQAPVSAFDWQQADFVSGSQIVINFSSSINPPAGIIYSDGTGVTIEVIRTANGQATLRLTAHTGAGTNRREYLVFVNGAKGTRGFIVNQCFNSDSSTVIPITNGGTGASTPAQARSNIGITLQTSLNDQTSGRVTSVGSFGLGSTALTTINQESRLGSGFYISKMKLGGVDDNASVILAPFDANTVYQVILPTVLREPKMYLRILNTDSTVNGKLCEVYTTANTTKAADGTLKGASPIIQIFHDGSHLTNSESEGCVVTRLGVGEYLVSGCMGLNADAEWGGIDGGFDIPKDRNRQPLVWLDYEVNADGSVLVKTYHRTHPGAPAFARNEREGFAEGDPIDIPADQFVSVRVEMPADSIYNKKMEEAALIQAERDEAKRLEEEEAERAKSEQDRLEAEAIVEQERLRAEAEAATNSDEQPDFQQQ